MRKFRKGMALGLALASTLSMAACSSSTSTDATFDPSSTAATYGTKTITMQEANFMLRYEQWMEESLNSYMNQLYQYYGYANMWAAPSGEGSKTLGDYYKETVMAQLWQTNVLNDHAEELGIELSDAQKDAIATTVKNLRDTAQTNADFWNYTDATDEQITEWLTANAIAVLVNDKVKNDAEITITDEEVKSFTIDYIAVGKDATNETTAAETTEAVSEDADAADVAESVDAAADESAEAATQTEAETEAETEEQVIYKGEALADKVLENIKAGTPATAAAAEMNNLSSLSQSYRYAEDDETITSNVLFTEGSKLAADETVKVDNPDGGWYIIHCSSDDDLLAAEDARDTVTKKKQAEAFNAKYAEWVAAAPAFTVDKNWDKVKITDLIYVAPVDTATEETEDDAAVVADDLVEAASEEAVSADAASADVANADAAAIVEVTTAASADAASADDAAVVEVTTTAE